MSSKSTIIIELNCVFCNINAQHILYKYIWIEMYYKIPLGNEEAAQKGTTQSKKPCVAWHFWLTTRQWRNADLQTWAARRKPLPSVYPIQKVSALSRFVLLPFLHKNSPRENASGVVKFSGHMSSFRPPPYAYVTVVLLQLTWAALRVWPSCWSCLQQLRLQPVWRQKPTTSPLMEVHIQTASQEMHRLDYFCRLFSCQF